MRELSLNILDIVTNSIEADASRVIIVIEEFQSTNMLRLRIRDNGKGMDKNLVNKVLDPFVTTRTTRAVGMGLSLLRQLAVQCGGDLLIKSAPGKGTTVAAMFQLNNLDRPPLGDIADSIVNLIIGSPDVHFVYIHKTDIAAMYFDSFWLPARMEEEGVSIYSLVSPAKDIIRQKLIKIKSSA